MTNEQAIKKLKDLTFDATIDEQDEEALDMAIEALQQQGNLLDRNDLYDSFKHDDDGSEWSMEEILSRIQNFPSAKETEDFWSEQYQDIDDYPDTDGDYISRQDAIDALEKDEEYNKDIPIRADGIRDAIITISSLPSAHPEIIRCNECKHYQGEDSWLHCNRVTWLNGEDDFCSRAERRVGDADDETGSD